MTHSIIQDLTKRYTTKKYDASKRISEEDISIIKEAIRLSASSINSQPWKFVLIESDEAKSRLDATFANKYQPNRPHATEASHVILFAHNPNYQKEDYRKVLDINVELGRLTEENYDAMLNGAFHFADLHRDESGSNSHWTKSQVYIALGNALHVLARLGIDSTPMEGIDTELVSEVFADELDGYVCDVALAMGYHAEDGDYNHGLPKSRLAMEDVFTVV
ncbi:nitroreductase family protein [Vibrio sp. JC009]|uniref:nitroreductase family protein n=1 Tax=Vibrio sp. JC009 TaxID=2912314 RepID=UPI0023AE74AD|nr:nitroreductase family protein [Vibrio sp. JC009]WED23373.1 nitroreductase family protein [Vibrio sp. JC009]